jgi:hypothetical protein
LPLLPSSVTIPSLFSDGGKENIYAYSKEKGDFNLILVKSPIFTLFFAIFSRFYDLVSRLFQREKVIRGFFLKN